MGGDAIVRSGTRSHDLALRVGLVVLGGVVLTGYGVVVNAPTWDFGRLLGVYVAVFFVSAQVVNLVAFRAVPTPPVLVGGALVVAGGLVMTLWR